jgi:hypothetical protein
VAAFVPPDFDVPLGLETSEFVLEPLGPEHNEQDYDQAHFGHELRTFTGLTRYLDVRRRLLREHPGHALDSDR